MIPKFRAWYGAEMYDEPVIHNGEFYLDWRDFIDGNAYDGAVLMQSTGLTDKNGVEIFEGDVVEYRNILVPSANKKGIVKYFDEWAMFGMDVSMNEPGALFFNGISDHISLEVIGNIYENPDLLEGLGDG